MSAEIPPTTTPTTIPPIQKPPGFHEIFKHVLLLFLILFIVLVVLSSITLVSRLVKSRKRNHSKKLSLRTRAEVYLTVSGIIQWIEAIQTFLSIISVIVFIYGTYLTSNPPLAYSWIEIALTIFFTLHWMLDYFISKDRLKYLFSFFSIVDLVTVLPIYIDISTGQFFSELTTFQFLRVLRTVRILRANRVLHYFEDITQYLFRVVIAIFTFIMIFAAFYMNIDVKPNGTGEALKFHETIYFFVVTLTTDGYGDIHPTNAVGQLTITLAVVVGAVLIPYQVSRLLETLNSYSPYKRDLSKNNLHGHVILCGDINFTSLLEFLTEFYLEKYGQLKKTIVILSTNPPSDQLKMLLLHPFYKNRINYLQGSPMMENDLKRARYIHSSSCFIFRPLFWEDGDSTAILTALAMKNLKPKGSKIFVQLLHHENKYKISARVKYIMCIEDFRNGILVQSTLCPGFGTLVCNLFTSRQPDLGDEDKWIGEYCNGSVNSIYKIPVPLAFVGETFLHVTSIMYSGAKALVLGYIDEQPPPPVIIVPPPNVKTSTNHTKQQQQQFPQQKRNKFIIHPPFSTVITATMSLIIIAHSPSAPTFKPNVPSIIRKDLDDDELPKTSFFTNIYHKLFVPEEVRHFTELGDSQDVMFNDNLKSFFTSTFTNNSSNIEMDVLSPTSSNTTTASSPTTISSPTQILISDINDGNGNTTTNEPNQPLISNSSGVIGNNNMFLSPIPEHSSLLPMDDINLVDDKISPLVSLCNQEFDSNWNEVIATVIESIDSKKAHMEQIVEDLEPVLESIERNRNLDEYSEDEKEDNNWKEHIIICGSINKIDLFIRGLRQKYISDNLNHFYHLKNQQNNPQQHHNQHHNHHGEQGSSSNPQSQPHQQHHHESSPVIVILHSEEPDMSDWDDIDDVFYHKGSPLERKDLDAVKIHLASKIIILSDPYKEHHSSQLTDKTSVQLDSQTIMAFLEISEVFQNHPNPSSFVTVELVHEPNIRFISKNIKSSKIGSKAASRKEGDEIEKPNYYITSEFASGRVLTLTTLDSLLCQANHQEYLLDVANELVLGVNGIRNYHRKLIRNQSDSDSDSDNEDYYYNYSNNKLADNGDSSDSDDDHRSSHSGSGSGHISANNKLHSTQSSSTTLRSSRNNSSTNLGYKNLNSRLSQSGIWNHHGNQHSNPNQCLLNQIKVPTQYHGHLYSELFETLIHKNILPLGLYRCKEITGAPNSYVFTCPPTDTILHEKDLVYILYRQTQ